MRIYVSLLFFHSLPPDNQILIPEHRFSRHTCVAHVPIPLRINVRSFNTPTEVWNGLPSNIALVIDTALFKAARGVLLTSNAT